jgi:hypothetical protein
MPNETSNAARSENGSETDAGREEQLNRALELVRQALSTLRFGQVVVTVQDGFVVQIERSEKTRLR